MAIYMIDYENVKTGGLNGISRLTEEDSVIIFYSENANRLTFDLHQRLMASRAKIEYREVTVGGHNALDFQLVTYLGYLIAQDKEGQYLIISNDRGFEYVVNFWRKDGLCIGLLPYLKDPAYALQRIARTEPVCTASAKEDTPASEDTAEEAAPEEVRASEELPAEAAPEEEAVFAEELPAEDSAKAEENITVEFFAIEEEPAQEEPLPEPAPAPIQEAAPAAEAETPAAEMPAAEEAPAPESKPKRKCAPKKPAQKKAAPKKSDAAQSAEKPARKLPTQAELREMLGDSVADDPELRFVMASLEKYKTKLGLNNALVKNFGNQRAGEIYQKVKPLVK